MSECECIYLSIELYIFKKCFHEIYISYIRNDRIGTLYGINLKVEKPFECTREQSRNHEPPAKVRRSPSRREEGIEL